MSIYLRVVGRFKLPFVHPIESAGNAQHHQNYEEDDKGFAAALGG
jgi:hypothetical protein